MLNEITVKSTENLSETEKNLLLDYFKFKSVIDELKANHSELCKQFGIETEKPKRTRKVKSVATDAIISPETITTPEIDTTVKTVKVRKNKAREIAERIAREYNERFGVTERERLYSLCPDCGGHFRVTIDYTIETDEQKRNWLRVGETKAICDDCGLTGKNGNFISLITLCKALGFDLNVPDSKSIYKGFERIPEPVQAETVPCEPETEPETLYDCLSCEIDLIAESDLEMDENNLPCCPYCNSASIVKSKIQDTSEPEIEPSEPVEQSEPIEAEIAYSNIM